jgi:hypothetical protein
MVTKSRLALRIDSRPNRSSFGLRPSRSAHSLDSCFSPRAKRFPVLAPIERSDRSNCFPGTCASVVFGSAENLRTIRRAKAFVRARRPFGKPGRCVASVTASFCIPLYYFTLQAVAPGRFSLIAWRTALSAARRSAGSAARYWATVRAVMLATIPAELCGRTSKQLRLDPS